MFLKYAMCLLVNDSNKDGWVTEMAKSIIMASMRKNLPFQKIAFLINK